MWPIPASKKASTSRPRRKISLARVTRILHKRVFITFAPESRSDVAAGWGGRWCWPLPLGAASWTGRRAQQPTLRLAVSWFSSVSPVIFRCCLPQWPKPVARKHRPGVAGAALNNWAKRTTRSCRDPILRRETGGPERGGSPALCFFLFFTGTVASDRVCTVYAGLNRIAVLAAALRCRAGSPRGRVGQILPQCTAHTSSASRAA